MAAARRLTYGVEALPDPIDAYGYSNFDAQFYRVTIGDVDITTTVTNSEIQIREWMIQAKAKITASRCIGLTIKTAPWGKSLPRAVICAFCVGDICLMVRLPKKKKAIPSFLSEFLFQKINVFAGIKIQESLHILLQGIKGGSGRPSFCDINVRAVERYNDPFFLHANQYTLALGILNQRPTYPAKYDTNFGSESIRLDDYMIAAINIDTYLAYLMGQELLGPEQGIKEEKKGMKRDKIEEEESGRPEKKVKIEKGGA